MSLRLEVTICDLKFLREGPEPPYPWRDLSSGDPARSGGIWDHPPETARRSDATRNGFRRSGTYKKLTGTYKRGSGTQFPEPRIQIRANFEEMRASGIWLHEAGTAFREAGFRLQDTGQRKKPAGTAWRASAKRLPDSRLYGRIEKLYKDGCAEGLAEALKRLPGGPADLAADAEWVLGWAARLPVIVVSGGRRGTAGAGRLRRELEVPNWYLKALPLARKHAVM
jgi:hypothetical protein